MTHKCIICDKQFSKRQNMVRHCRHFHGINLPSKAPENMVCGACSRVFANNEEFNRHLSTVHNYVAVIENLTFSVEEEFYEWKRGIEESEVAKFVVRNSKRVANVKQVYYRCNRDGPVRLRVTSENRKRIFKKGSRKTNYHCPSRITANIHENGQVDVEYCSTHFGHKLELKHVRTPSSVKKGVVNIVAKEIPIAQILIPGNLNRKLFNRQSCPNINSRPKTNAPNSDQTEIINVDCSDEQNSGIVLPTMETIEEIDPRPSNMDKENTKTSTIFTCETQTTEPWVIIIGEEANPSNLVLTKILSEGKDNSELSVEALKKEARSDFNRLLDICYSIEDVTVVKNALKNCWSKIDTSERQVSFS